MCIGYHFSSVALWNCVQLSATLWTAAHQVSLSITNSQSLLKFMSIESVMPSNHLLLCRPLLLSPSIFPNIRVFSSESVRRIRWPSIGVSALASVLPMNTQDWFPLRWTGWISLQWINECSQSVFPKTLWQVYYSLYSTNKTTRHREADGFVQNRAERKQQSRNTKPVVTPNAPHSISSSSCLQTQASSLTLPVFLFLASPRIPSPGV